MNYFSPIFSVSCKDTHTVFQIKNNEHNLIQWPADIVFKLKDKNSTLKSIADVYIFDTQEAIELRLGQPLSSPSFEPDLQKSAVWVLVKTSINEYDLDNKETAHTLPPMCFNLSNVNLKDYPKVSRVINQEITDTLTQAHQKALQEYQASLDKKYQSSSNTITQTKGVKPTNEPAMTKADYKKLLAITIGVMLLLQIILTYFLTSFFTKNNLATQIQPAPLTQVAQSSTTPLNSQEQELSEVMQLQRNQYTDPNYLADIQQIAHENALKDIGIDIEQMRADNSCFVE